MRDDGDSPAATEGQPQKKRTWLWIILGVIAVLAVAALITNGDDDTTTTEASGTTPSDIEQVEWAITLGDYTGTEVLLKGDLPGGYPTETWEDGELLDRDPEGDFAWTLNEQDLDGGPPVPSPIWFIDQNTDDCTLLEADLDLWESQAEDPTNAPDLTARNLAFAQHARNLATAANCEL